MLSKDELVKRYTDILLEYKSHLRKYYIYRNQEATKEILVEKSIITAHQEFILQKNYVNRTCEYIQERMNVLRTCYLDFLRRYTLFLENTIKENMEDASTRKSELSNKWKKF